jgi:carboxyl-terminal processing protease
MDTLLYRDAFFHFAPHYLVNHTVGENFKVDDVVVGEFKQFLTSQNIPWTNEDFVGPIEWVKANIKAELETSQYGQLTGLRVRADWDPMIQKAVTYLPEAQALEDNAHKVLAQKAEARNGASN